MARGNAFRVPASWVESYKQKRTTASDPKKATAATKKRLAVENPHEKELAALYKDPGKEKGKLEHYAQVRIFNFFYQFEDVYDLMYSVPNGGARDVVTGAQLKAGGLKRGMPDINLDKPAGAYHGLRLELKVGKGKPTEEQIQKLNLLDKQGYFAVLCYGTQEAIDVITAYLNLTAGQEMPPQQHEHLWKGKNV